jgi:hypothetical protein
MSVPTEHFPVPQGHHTITPSFEVLKKMLLMDPLLISFGEARGRKQK